MASFVDFPQANDVLRANPEQPESSPGNPIGDLAVFRDPTQLVSCWQLTPAEVLDVMRTGRIYLFVLGQTHPPVHVQGTDPWAPPPGAFEPAESDQPEPPAAA